MFFEDSSYAAIGISDIDFEAFQEKINENTIIEFEGRKYLICDVVLPKYLKGTKLEGPQASVASENITSIISYEFP